MLIVAYTAHSMINIAYLSWGARLADTSTSLAPTSALLGAAGWREGLGLVGVIAAAFILGFIFFMKYSRPGRAMRALAQDRVAAQLMGVEVDRYTMIGFAMGAMLAGVTGGLLVTITGINSGIGGPISIKAFMMIMIGGAGVAGGAIAGGFILGMMESVGLTVLREFGDVTYLVIFAALMVFLSIRPNGLMGKPWG